MKINIGTNSTHISLKAHKGRSYLRLSPDSYDQKIAVISPEKFRNLKS